MKRKTAIAAVALAASGVPVAYGVAQTFEDQPPMPVLPEGVTDDDLPRKERITYQDALIASAAPGRDNADPRTINGVLPDGRKVTVMINTQHPELFEGMDIDDFAEEGLGSARRER